MRPYVSSSQNIIGGGRVKSPRPVGVGLTGYRLINLIISSTVLHVHGWFNGFENFVIFAMVAMYVKGINIFVGVEYIDKDLGARG